MSQRARKRIIFLLVLGVAGVGVVAAGLQWRSARRAHGIAEAREQGLALYAEGRWSEAMTELNKSARFVKDDPDVMVALADSRRNVPLEGGRHIRAAINFAQQALATDPDNEKALELLVDLYAQIGQVTELIDVSKRLLELDPDHHEARWSEAMGLASLGRPGAIEATDRLLERFPDDVRGHALRIQLMLAQGASADEVRAYADAQAAARPRSADFLLLQAEARVRTSTEQESLDELRASAERASDIQIERPETLARLVQLLDMLGLTERADEILTRELAKGANQDAVAIAVERDWKAGRIEQARSRALAAAEADPDGAADAVLGWAVMLAPPDQPQGSQSPYYETLRLRSGVGARFWINLIDGREALARGDWGTARGSLSAATLTPLPRSGGLAPLDIAEYLLGRAELALGDWREAAARWDHVASRNPSWTGVRLELSALMLQNGRAHDALNHAGRVLSRNPGNYDAGKAAARAMVALLELGEVPVESSDETVALLQELAGASKPASDAEYAQILALEARVRLVRGETDFAQRAVDQLVELGVTPPAEDLLALIERAEPASLAGLDRIKAPADAGPLVAHRAQQIADMGRSDEAKAYFTEAIGDAPAAEKPDLERLYAVWLEHNNDPEGLSRLIRLAETNARSTQAQVDLLNAPSVWSDEAAVEAAIARLRDVGGESSVAWRIYEARRLLTFEPSEARAAQAVELLGPGLRSSAPDASALTLAGEAMIMLGDVSTASDYYGRAIDADGRRWVLYPRLITMLQSSGRLDLAETRQREFLKISRLDPAQQRRRAELSESLGLWDAAVTDRAALAEAPGAGAGEHARLGAALARAGRVGEADAQMNQLAGQSLSDPDTVSLVADYLAARGRGEDASAVIARADIDEETQATMSAALLIKRGLPDQAVAVLEQATRAHPSAELWAALARTSLRAGRLDAARAAVNQGQELDADSAELAALDAAVKLQSGQSAAPEALAELARATARSDVDPALTEIIQATQQLSETNDLGAYLATLEGVYAKHQRSLLIMRLLATAYLQNNQGDKAVSIASHAARVFPGQPEAAQLAAETLALTGRLTEAETMAARWLNQASDQLPPREALARLAMARGSVYDADDALAPVRERILSEAADAPGRFELLATVTAAAGRFDEAREMLLARAGDGDTWADIFIRVAGALDAPPATVRDWLSEAEPYAGDRLGALAVLAQGWADLGARTGDRSAYEEVVRLLDGREGVERSAAVMLLAVSFEQLGEYRRAEERYRQMLRLVPDQPIALNNLAYLLLKEGKASDEAVTLARRAVSGAQELGYPAGSQASFQHTLGELFGALERPDDSEQAFRAGLELSPQSPYLLLSLAELLAGRDRGDEAATLLGRINTEAVSNDPEFTQRYDALKQTLSQADPDS